LTPIATLTADDAYRPEQRPNICANVQQKLQMVEALPALPAFLTPTREPVLRRIRPMMRAATAALLFVAA
jgi:hypothetical protein